MANIICASRYGSITKFGVSRGPLLSGNIAPTFRHSVPPGKASDVKRCDHHNPLLRLAQRKTGVQPVKREETHHLNYGEYDPFTKVDSYHIGYYDDMSSGLPILTTEIRGYTAEHYKVSDGTDMIIVIDESEPITAAELAVLFFLTETHKSSCSCNACNTIKYGILMVGDHVGKAELGCKSKPNPTQATRAMPDWMPRYLLSELVMFMNFESDLSAMRICHFLNILALQTRGTGLFDHKFLDDIRNQLSRAPIINIAPVHSVSEFLWSVIGVVSEPLSPMKYLSKYSYEIKTNAKDSSSFGIVNNPGLGEPNSVGPGLPPIGIPVNETKKEELEKGCLSA